MNGQSVVYPEISWLSSAPAAQYGHRFFVFARLRQRGCQEDKRWRRQRRSLILSRQFDEKCSVPAFHGFADTIAHVVLVAASRDSRQLLPRRILFAARTPPREGPVVQHR